MYSVWSQPLWYHWYEQFWFPHREEQTMNNPANDKKSPYRTVRNGNFDSFAGGTRVIFRLKRWGRNHRYDYGFRIVRNKR